MKHHALAIGLGILLLSAPLRADETIRQTRVSVTLGVPNFTHAANDLREVSQSFDASLENLNMDSASGSGNASFKVPAKMVPEVMAALEKIGQLQNQNQSTSDYTSSVQQYERKAKAFRALSQLDTGNMFAKLSPEQRTEVIAEFQNFVNHGLQSNESSAANYRSMGKFVEISVSLTSAPLPANSPPALPDPAPALSEDPAPAAPATDTRPIYLLCLLNFLGLWAIYRRVDQPDHQVPTPHTH
jgi:hypothetical protein